MAASGNYVCHQARILFAEGLSRMPMTERRDALRKLMLEIVLSTDIDPHLEKILRMAYNDLSDAPVPPQTGTEDGNVR